MVGPLFQQELLLGGRRNRLYIFRWFYAGWLIVVLLFFFARFLMLESARQFALMRSNQEFAYRPSSAPQVVGGWFAEFFVFQQLILLALVIPPLVAGAITEEKRRGTLQYLLTTELDSRHIVLGKLLGRVAQVLWLLLTGLPLFALMAGFGGVAPSVLGFLVLVYLPVVVAMAGVSILASVLCRQTRDAVIAVYGVGTFAWLVYYLGPPGLEVFNPCAVVAPVWASQSASAWSEAWMRFGWSALAWGGIGTTCLIVASWRLRPVYIRELVGSTDKRASHWYNVERAPVSDDPVSWRERNVEGLAPSPTFRRIPFGVGVALVAGLTTLSSLLILSFAMPKGGGLGQLLQAAVQLNFAKLTHLLPRAEVGFFMQSVIVLLLASFVVGVRCSGAVVGERERSTWEPMLMSPMSAKQMIRSKLWGVLGASYWYLLAYAAPAICLSILGGVLAFLLTVMWLAVTFLAMYYVGAAGLWCSTRATSSWRSLLSTLGFGYLGGIAILVPTSLVSAVLAMVIVLAMTVLDTFLGTNLAGVAARGFSNYATFFVVALSLALALAFYLASRLFLHWAVRWVADRERTRHWDDEPIYRRPRRRRRQERARSQAAETD